MLLFDILRTQDIGDADAHKICDDAINNDLNATRDPISCIIATSFMDNEYLYSDENKDSFINDMDYAINQLKKARDFVHKNA